MASAKKVAAKKAAPKSTKKPVHPQTASKVANRAITMAAKKEATAPKASIVASDDVTLPAPGTKRVEVIDGVKVYHGITLPQRAVAITSDLDKIKVGGLVFFDATIDTSVYKDAGEALKAQREAAAVKANRANGQVRRYTKRNPDTKFIVRTLPNAKSMGFDTDVGVVIQRTK